jgi:hypothetical protein
MIIKITETLIGRNIAIENISNIKVTSSDKLKDLQKKRLEKEERTKV